MNYKELLPHFQNKIETYTSESEIYKKQRFWLGILRFASFSLFGWALVSWIVSGTLWYFTIPSFAVFLIFVSIDRRVEDKLKLILELIAINEKEIRLLNSDLSDLDDGSDFLDANHPYCNDLNLFGKGSLFQYFNRSTTNDGKRELARRMKNISTSPERIRSYQEAISELRSVEDWRQQFNAVGNLIKESDYNVDNVVTWFKNNDRKLERPRFKGIIFGLPIINISLIALFIFDAISASLGFSMILIQLFVYGGYAKTINWYAQSLSSFSSSIKKYDALISTLEQVEFKSELTTAISTTLTKGKGNAIKEITIAKKLLNRLESRNNILVAILFNGLYLRDLHVIRSIDKWQKRNIERFPVWFNAIARLDALNSLAGFSFNNPDFTLPTLSENTRLDAKDLGHPLILRKERIDNNLNYASSSFFYIVTGANMAGKSTFLRTVSVNLIMASLGLPVCAKSFTYRPVKIFTSIGTIDDLIEHTSYFKAELLRLKKLFDTASSGEPLFVVLDEILKGTNSEDKRKGSIGVLKKITKKNVYGIIATHDLDLGKLENDYPDTFKNICFEIAFEKDQMLFDYKLRNGITQNMNASYLLKNMGLI